MRSHRLPGKVLVEIAGKPLLEYLLERLERAASLDTVIVATSAEPEDDAIARYVRSRGIPCFRGKHDDVAGRILDAAHAHELGGFVRVSGDSPLLDPVLVDRAVAVFRSEPVDLVTNVQPRTYPSGQSVELVRTSAFAAAYEAMEGAEDREHVTPFLYRNADRFRIVRMTAPVPYDSVRLSIDTEADLDRIAHVVARMDRPHWEYGLDEVVSIYRELT